jgi:hypothetical protein
VSDQRVPKVKAALLVRVVRKANLEREVESVLLDLSDRAAHEVPRARKEKWDPKEFPVRKVREECQVKLDYRVCRALQAQPVDVVKLDRKVRKV